MRCFTISAPPLRGAVDDRVELRLVQQLRDRDAAHGRVGDQRHHRVAVPAEHHRLDVAHRDVERLGEERAVARRVEHAGHADHALAREAGDLHRDVAHHVERVRDDDDDRVRRGLRDVLGDRLHDAGVRVEQVVAAHARLAGDAGRDDDDVGARRFVVAVGADDARVEQLDRRRLPLVEPFPCGMPSATSTITTVRASSFSAMRCAVVAPTLPAPTTVILLTIGLRSR